ncbi:ATPase, partial [Escherichia coli]|nr:ATPase [Escherichia coli]
AAEPQDGALYLRTVTLETGGGRQAYEVAAHRVDDLVVLELEEIDAAAAEIGVDVLTPRLRAFVERLQTARTVEDLCRFVAEDIR